MLILTLCKQEIYLERKGRLREGWPARVAACGTKEMGQRSALLSFFLHAVMKGLSSLGGR